MHSALGATLLQSYASMSACADAVAQAIEADGSDYPVVLPTFRESVEDTVSDKARQEAIRSITQLHFNRKEGDHPVVRTGILCASEATIALIEQFNAAKTDFRQAVMAIRAVDQGETDAIVSSEVTRGRRTPLLYQLLRTAKISTLDLKRCYAQIRVLPSNVASFRWSWETRHARLKKMSVPEALTLLDALPAEQAEAVEVARKLLASCSPSEQLVRKTAHGARLRANYTVVENGEKTPHACAISGIVIQPGTTLPKYKWRDRSDEPGETRERRGVGVQQHPYIQVLDLYRYDSL